MLIWCRSIPNGVTTFHVSIYIYIYISIYKSCSAVGSCGPLLLLFAYTEHRVRRYCIVVLATRWLFLYTLYANRSVSRSNIQTYVWLPQLWKLVPIYRVRWHCIVVLVTRWLFPYTLCANHSVIRVHNVCFCTSFRIPTCIVYAVVPSCSCFASTVRRIVFPV